MIKANFSAYGTYVTDSLYQWDINRILSVSGLNLEVAPEVHFSNASMDKAIVKQATLAKHIVSVPIPNSLLQDPLTIRAHIGIYEGDTFRVIETVEIPVKAKARPSDYRLEDSDEEIYSFAALENAIANIVAVESDTVGAHEVADIRRAADGKIHASAGMAVRAQITALAEAIDILNRGGLNLKEDFIGEQVNAWLDDHPEATTTVQDGALTLSKFSDELKPHILKDYVTPQMFGAKGDGVTDDTDSLQRAIVAGSVVDLLGKTYKITNSIVLHSDLIVKNGGIIGENVTDLFSMIGNSVDTVKNVTIESVSFDGNMSCNVGVYARYGENVQIENCFFFDFYGETASAFGVHLRDCKRSNVKTSKFDTIEAKTNGIVGDNVGAARGVIFTDTTESIIECCDFTDIISTDDGDAVHIASSVNTEQSFFGNITIRNNMFENVGRSAIKIQQSGVLISDNEFLSTDTLEYYIRSYSSNVTIENNRFTGNVQIPIYIGSTSAILYENHIIQGNVFECTVVDYQGCICIGDGKHVKNFIVKNNVASLDENKYFVYARGWAENFNVTDNVVENCNCVAYFRKPSDDSGNSNVNKNIIISNNMGTCYWYVARFDDCNTLYEGIIVSGNIFKYLATQNAMYRYTAYLQNRVYSKYPLIVNNDVSNVNGVTIYDGYVKKDVLSNRPTQGVHVGDMYYDTESGRFWFCKTRALYDKDGSLLTAAEWI